jgi:hypothetical protein
MARTGILVVEPEPPYATSTRMLVLEPASSTLCDPTRGAHFLSCRSAHIGSETPRFREKVPKGLTGNRMRRRSCYWGSQRAGVWSGMIDDIVNVGSRAIRQNLRSRFAQRRGGTAAPVTRAFRPPPLAGKAQSVAVDPRLPWKLLPLLISLICSSGSLPGVSRLC